MNFLGGKEQNQVTLELHCDSFQSFIRTATAISEDLQFQINRLRVESEDESQKKKETDVAPGKAEVLEKPILPTIPTSPDPTQSKPVKKEPPKPKDDSVLFDETDDNIKEFLEESGSDFHFVENDLPDLNAEPEYVVFPNT